MPTSTLAPGAPGIRPTWTSSAKDLVTTALGGSRVWVTMGFGIVNEIYWPATGTPQIRDLGFIVAGPAGWSEVKRVAQYTVTVPQPYVPLPRVVHEGEGWRLEIELLPAPLRDAVLVSYKLVGEGARLYVLLSPHLGNSGVGNNARAGADLVAWKDDNALCLVNDTGFARASAGYVGVSDGWQDFNRNGRMAWTYDEALDGNVALMGELATSEGLLALGFSEHVEGARTLARSSIAEGYDTLRQRFIQDWEDWGRKLVIPAGSLAVEREAYISAVVLKVHEDRSFPGSIVASLSVPWGNASDSSGGYHLVWARDCVEAGLALIGVGEVEDAVWMLCYLIATQRDDGHWSQNTFPDGRAFWDGIQLDEVGFPIVLAAKLAEQGALTGLGGVEAMVRRAVRYLVNHGPVSAQDRWEENAGISPFTIGIEIVALIAAAEFLAGEERAYALALADHWNERIEDWTYVADGPFAQAHGVAGYYVRLGPAVMDGGLRGRINVKNRSGEWVEAAALVGMEFLYLVRLGLRRADDPRILDSLKVAEALLRVETPQGTAYRRYNGDGYGEKEDGSPFDGSGIGRAWPLLAGERGHFDLLAGRDPLPWLETMARMTGPAGLIPEQVWDGPAIPERMLAPGRPSGSAMPLVWAHAEFLKLLIAREKKRPLERLASVEEHLANGAGQAAAWYWRPDTPFDALPKGRELMVDMGEPFTLHMGFDGWHGVADRKSSPLPFGRHGVRLGAADLAGHHSLEFTLYMADEGRWEGRDQRIALAS
ncbi:glycoside hydrolase family 15 protein [Reyranella sp.]|jgi:glucoamylase|uniref:glycoside hydrolase family 15 protein n=1 Tax=Reyranella sp. TaxID=1929291 RepID=UPI002F920FAE